MAFLSGKNSDVVIGEDSYKFEEWRATFKVDIIECTNFSSGGAAENLDGIKSAQITLKGKLDSGDMAFTGGALVTLILKASSSVSYTVPARLETIEQTANVKGAVEVVLTFQSSGAFSAVIS